MKAQAVPAAGRTGERTAGYRCPAPPESSASPAQKCRKVVAYIPHSWCVNANILPYLRRLRMADQYQECLIYSSFAAHAFLTLRSVLGVWMQRISHTKN